MRFAFFAAVLGTVVGLLVAVLVPVPHHFTAAYSPNPGDQSPLAANNVSVPRGANVVARWSVPAPQVGWVEVLGETPVTYQTGEPQTPCPGLNQICAESGSFSFAAYAPTFSLIVYTTGAATPMTIHWTYDSPWL